MLPEIRAFLAESRLIEHRHYPELSGFVRPASCGAVPACCLHVSFESVLALYPSTTTELPFT